MADRFLLKKFASETTDCGQFGSFQATGAKIGDGVKTTDPALIQGLPAWLAGWGNAVDNGLLLPRLEEMNGVQRVFAEMLWNQWRDGMTFWQEGAPVKALQSVVMYQTGDELPKVYVNKTGANGANPPPQDTDNWALLFDSTNTQLLSNMEQAVSTATDKYPSSKAVNDFANASAAPVGSMIIWGGPNAPAGRWIIANGAAISRTTYAELFAIYGTTWGAGDGNTTFNLPNAINKTVWQSSLGVGGATFGSLPDHQHHYAQAASDSGFGYAGVGYFGNWNLTTRFVSDDYSGTVYSKAETQVVPSSIFINFYVKY